MDCIFFPMPRPILYYVAGLPVGSSSRLKTCVTGFLITSTYLASLARFSEEPVINLSLSIQLGRMWPSGMTAIMYVCVSIVGIDV